MGQVIQMMRGVKYEGDASSPTAVEIPVMVTGTADYQEARSQLLAEFPEEYLAMRLSEVNIRTQIAGDRYRGYVRYVRDNVPAISGVTNRPEPAYSFDAGGESQHIISSLETVALYGNSSLSRLSGMIGYDEQGIQGADIYAKTYAWSETHYFRPSEVDQTYKLRAANLAQTVNAVAFRGFPRGEVLLRRIAGSRRGDKSSDWWELQFQFERRPNRLNVNVGGINVASKEGWQLVWAYYEQVKAAGIIYRRPAAVFVERVYDYGDYSLLGL